MSRAERNRQLAAEIAQKIKEAKERNNRVSFAGRLEVLHKGMNHYTKRDAVNAVREYQRYISALEMWKQAKEGSLTPKHFDIKVDRAELLLISGIYWDLAKLLDKVKSEKRRIDFLHYIQKYVEFTKGMPYEPMAAENLRKYIRSGKAEHEAEFKNAYTQLGGSSCVVATSLSPFVAESEIANLRKFRSQWLEKRNWGMKLSKWYSRNGLELSFWMDRRPEALRKIAARLVRWFSFSVRGFRSGSDGK